MWTDKIRMAEQLSDERMFDFIFFFWHVFLMLYQLDVIQISDPTNCVFKCNKKNNASLT